MSTKLTTMYWRTSDALAGTSHGVRIVFTVPALDTCMSREEEAQINRSVGWADGMLLRALFMHDQIYTTCF